MRVEKVSLDAILENFELKISEASAEKEEGKPLTLWLPASEKARYDRLQKKTRRGFGKQAREVMIALMKIAEAQAS